MVQKEFCPIALQYGLYEQNSSLQYSEHSLRESERDVIRVELLRVLLCVLSVLCRWTRTDISQVLRLRSIVPRLEDGVG